MLIECWIGVDRVLESYYNPIRDIEQVLKGVDILSYLVSTYDSRMIE